MTVRPEKINAMRFDDTQSALTVVLWLNRSEKLKMQGRQTPGPYRGTTEHRALLGWRRQRA
jgi:hypothetical protein